MKNTFVHRCLGWCAAVAVAAAILGCSAESRKARHESRANAFFERERYEEASIEYMNALRYDPTSTELIRQLALCYYNAGDLMQAFPILGRVYQDDPADLDVGSRLGTIYLAGGEFARAHEIAEEILAQQSDHLDALLLLADASIEPDQIEEAMRTLEDHPAEDARLYVGIGNLHMRRRDLDQAKVAYDRALAVDEGTPIAHMALGHYYEVAGDPDAARASYARATEVEPDNVNTWLKHADFEKRMNNRDEARSLLERVLEKQPASSAALYHLAELAFAERDYDRCEELVERLKKVDAASPRGRVLEGRVLLARGQTEEGVAIFEQLVGFYPRSAECRYYLGVAYVRSGDPLQARRELEQGVALEPTNGDMVLLYSQLKLQAGDADDTVDLLRGLLARQPRLAAAYVMLGTAYRIQGDLPQAQRIYEAMVDAFPEEPQGQYFLGLVKRQGGDDVGARSAFEEALARSPEFLAALLQLVSMDIDGEDYDTANARIDRLMEASPEAEGLWYLRGRVALARKDYDAAIAAFEKTIEIEPRYTGAYLAIGQVYMARGEQEEALARFGALLEVEPENLQSLMLTAMLNEQMSRFDEARSGYEKILSINPDFGAAANNLSYLYAEYFDDLDKALELAQRAKELAPEDPHVLDTLGWIVFLRGDYTWAHSLLSQSAERMPAHPEIQYHLGLACYRLGKETDARMAFERALALSTNFQGAARSKDYLELLSDVRGDTDIDAQLAHLDALLSEDPENPLLIVRRGVLLERSGDIDGSVALFRGILASDENFVPALVELAEALAAQDGGLDEAYVLAQQARRLAPDDPRTAQIFGWVNYLKGDHGWAASLLEESARSGTASDVTKSRLALAYYMTGREADALSLLQDVPDGADAVDGPGVLRRVLSVDASDQGIAYLESVLAAKPRYVPALMQKARGLSRASKIDAAVATYEQVLDVIPNFPPAERDLALLFAQAGREPTRTYDMATRARSAFPDDAILAGVLGGMALEREEYIYALPLLEQKIRTHPGDTVALHQVGICQYHLGKKEEARLTLEKALALDPSAAPAVESRRILEELAENGLPNTPDE